MYKYLLRTRKGDAIFNKRISIVTVPRHLNQGLIRSNNTTVLTNSIIQLITSENIKKNDNSNNLKLYNDYWYANYTSQKQFKQNVSVLPRIDIPQFIQFINRWKGKLPVIRSFYRKEIIFNIDDYDRVLKFINLLIGKDMKNSLQSQNDILQWCIDDSLQFSDILIASDLFILYYNLHPNEIPNQKYAQKIISALAYQHPKYDQLHLEKFLKICNLLKLHNITPIFRNIDILLFCNKTLSDNIVPILAKTVLNIILDTELSLISDITNFQNEKMRVAYTLIDKDYKIDNVAGVYSTWTRIKNDYISFTKHDSRILYKVFKICSRHRAYRSICKEMLWNIAPEYYCNDPLLLPTIIDHISSIGSFDLAKKISEDMNQHTSLENQQAIWLSKRFLSSLLKMQLKFYNSQNVDNVIKEIVYVYGKLSPQNYGCLISYLLSTEKLPDIKKAISLLDSIPPKERFISYTSLVNKLIEWELASKNIIPTKTASLLNKVLEQAHQDDPNHTRSFWCVISGLYFKSLLKNKLNSRGETTFSNLPVLDLAKFLYIKGTDNAAKFPEITFNPFIESQPSNIKLKITNSNRFIILKNIAGAALKASRKDIFLWACATLFNEGSSVDELIIQWNAVFKHQIRKSHFKTREEIHNCLRAHGIKAFEEMLS